MKKKKELISELIEEETNVDFEVTERSTESRDKLTTSVYRTQNQKANDKIQKSSNKITPTVIKKKILDTPESATLSRRNSSTVEEAMSA